MLKMGLFRWQLHILNPALWLLISTFNCSNSKVRKTFHPELASLTRGTQQTEQYFCVCNTMCVFFFFLMLLRKTLTWRGSLLALQFSVWIILLYSERFINHAYYSLLHRIMLKKTDDATKPDEIKVMLYFVYGKTVINLFFKQSYEE